MGLSLLLERAVQAAKDAGYNSDQFQLVLVENGSKDHSSQLMDELKAGPLGNWFRKVQVPVNQGYGFGIMTGLKTTTATFVGWAHSDLQCDPKDAFKALAISKSELLKGKRTLVKGVRSGRNWKDIFVSRVFETFARVLLGLRTYEINAQPKVFPRELLSSVTHSPNNFAFDLYVLYQAAKKQYLIKTIPVLFPPRIHGASNWASNFLSRYKTILGMIRYMWELGTKEGRV
jgi:glycosyltransferase involved in cell wall biosynthesis